MGHKSVVIFDHDNLHRMKQDPVEFVRRLEMAILSHRRTGGDVSMNGATFANVVWSGHTDLTPVLRIQDFRAENVTYDVQELQALGFRVEPQEDLRNPLF